MFQVSLKILNQSTETHENQWQSYLDYFDDLDFQEKQLITFYKIHAKSKELEN